MLANIPNDMRKRTTGTGGSINMVQSELGCRLQLSCCYYLLSFI